MWHEEFEKIQESIKRKISFLEKKEKEIDLTKPDNYNKAIIARLGAEREFINDMIAFLYFTENRIEMLENSNKHLKAQNTIYFHTISNLESVIERGYESEITRALSGESE